MVSRSPVMAPRDGTGISGLDDVLAGGLPRNRLYLLKGQPGVGKTTLALQFLLEGVRVGERCLYITLSETEPEIRQVADSHGWSLDGIDLYELSSAQQARDLDDENTLYTAADTDLKETMRTLLEEVERVKPRRVVFDSLSEIRLLSSSPVRYRRQLLMLKQHFAGRECTALVLDDHTSGPTDLQVESLVHGVIALEQNPQPYGADRRRVRIVKLRGSPFRSGFHDYVVQSGGLAVFPRLIALEHRTEVLSEPVASGVAALDALLGGGIDRSTATLLVGPAGAGKSAIASQFASAAAERGEHVTFFLFEERIGTMRRRAQLLGIPIDRHIDEGTVRLHQIDPAELAPDEFTHLVREAVEVHKSRLVVIDSINGYINAMPEARYLSLQMHELLAYLSERGVASLLTLTQSGLMGANMAAPVDMSYLADTIVMLRYFEAGGRIRKAISVVKKRSGPHDDSIHELTLEGGVKVGAALSNMSGVLTGVPHVAADDER